MSSSKRRKKHRSSHNRPNDLFTANGDLLGELVETSIFDRALLVTLRGELQFPATLARRLRKNLINNSPGVFCWGGRGKCSKQTAKGLSELCTTGRLSSRSAAVRGSPDVQRRIWGGDAQWSAIARRRYPFNWIFWQRGSFADVSKNSGSKLQNSRSSAINFIPPVTTQLQLRPICEVWHVFPISWDGRSLISFGASRVVNAFRQLNQPTNEK